MERTLVNLTGGSMATSAKDTIDPEILAISQVYAALKDLNPDAQNRVIEYVSQKLELGFRRSNRYEETANLDLEPTLSAHSSVEPLVHEAPDELDGISPVASRWMRRNGLSAEQLSTIFSLGVDEIDLVAKKVPGNGKSGRMRSLFLLKGVAAYLSSGVARFTHEQIKEACLHYDAFDSKNFAKILKGLSAEVSGTKETDYTLTARGLTDAKDLIKLMTGV
jgi:hypothetical protein